MKTHMMRHFVAVFGIGILCCSHNAVLAQYGYSDPAQYGYGASGGDYRAPAKWNQFRPRDRMIEPIYSSYYQGPPVQPGGYGHPANYQGRHPQAAYGYAPQPSQYHPSGAFGGRSYYPDPGYHAAYQAAPPLPPAPYGRPAAARTQADSLPAPQDVPAPVPPQQYESILADGGEQLGDYGGLEGETWQGDCPTCEPAPQVCCPRPISPCFGGINAIAWDFVGCDRVPLVTDDWGYSLISTDDLNESSNLGYEVHFGRYLHCGRYALDFGYMWWDPDAFYCPRYDEGSGLRVNLPALQQILIDRGGGATTVYDDYDLNAASISAHRDLKIQGFEVNLNCFGLMGAQRLGSNRPGPVCSCLSCICGCGCYGGRTGPMSRSACGDVRVQTSHGIRWFQLKDDLAIIGDVDGTPGIHPSDLHYFSNVDNDLIGYQFGTSLAYCLTCRLMLTVGGKVGIYGNKINYYHRVTTDWDVAYTSTQGPVAGEICIDESDICLSGLSELDFGLGYRLCSRWTVNAGYRLLGAYGVATAAGIMPTEYSTVESAGAIRANDNLVLQGLYFGVSCNW